MQIVIDIPEDVIECAKSSPNYYPTYHFKEIWKAIVNGILLPKGHGRLIDADYLKNVALLHNFHGNNKSIVPYSDRKGYRLRQREVDEAIINVSTIIEADKAESEE